MHSQSSPANIISSHVLYKVKRSADNEMFVKARLVLHGNKETGAEDIRRDAANLHFALLRVIVTLQV